MRYYWIRWQEEGVLSPVPIAQQCVEEAQQKSLTGRAPSATCPRVCSEGKRGLLYNGLGDTVCHLPLGRSLERGSSCFPLSTLTFFFFVRMSLLPLDLFLYHCPRLWRFSHTGLLTVFQYSQDSSLWFPLPTSFWLLPLFAVLIPEISPGLPLSLPSHIWSERDTSIKLHPTISHCSAPYPAFLFHCN